MNAIQEFIYLNLNETLINKKFIKKVNEPKISVTITNYNGEGFLKKAIRSVQNQNFKEIEIIIIDDFSKDNSLKIIKELMKEDPRIKLLKNNENKGALYTKTKGILNSKGKYVLLLDVDDLYVSKNAFSTLYVEAEKNNLDMIGFASIVSDKNILNKTLRIIYYYETPILFQPNVSYRVYQPNKDGKIKQIGDVLWVYFFKADLFIKTIKDIPTKFLNRKINYHDDLLLLFLITRRAYNFKNIKRILHIYLFYPNSTDPLIYLDL